MRARTTGTAAAAVLVALVAVALAGPAGASGPSPGAQLVQAYAGTFRFLDVRRAEAAGYGEFRDAAGIACIEQPGVGAMGIHYVNGTLVGDAALHAARPEALVYEPLPGGGRRLVAAEYIVFQEAWDAAHDEPPVLFGRELHLVEAGNRYGIPAFYELHVWLWQPNPRGLFDDWNPLVRCPDA